MRRSLSLLLKFFLLSACLLLTFTAFAQAIEVTGNVTDEDKYPLIGASILLKGTSTGVISDVDGNYTIQAQIGDTLIFAYTGFETKEVIIKDSIINIKLEIASMDCFPTVLLPYPSVYTARQTTGAWSKLEKENFNIGNIHNPYQLIRGRIPGLTISKPGGDPLGTFDVQQRGLHTILGSSEPLLVVNGLPGASLFSFDVQDIESMTVLRDAAMTSLYGTRGANGVILIETKKGTSWKKLNINYSGYASIEKVSETPDVLSASQFRDVVNNSNSRFYNPTADLGASTNWADEITRTGISQAHNLSFSGRNKNTGYRLSLNYRDVNGVALKSGFDQTNALLYLSQNLFKDKLQLQANAGITHRNFTQIDQDVFYQSAIYNPTAPIRADTSRFGGYYQNQIFDYSNPVALLEQIDNQGEQTIYTANLSATWNIIEHLNAKIHYGWQQQDYTRNYKRAANAYPLGGISSRQKDGRSALDLNNQSLLASLSYNRYFNNHNFTLSGGYQYQEWKNILQNAYVYDLTANGLTFKDVYFKAQPDSLYKYNTELSAFFGNLQYDFDDWLFLNANWRHEGSNRFGENNKWGNFYGVGTGVDFARLIDISFADRLKLRVSYGVSGNLPVDGVYADAIFEPGGPRIATNENQNLKWEERREWNWGLDFSFFNTRVHGAVELYNGSSKDVLFNYIVPSPPNFASGQYENIIDFKNKGIELVLDATIFAQGDFFWEAGLNYAKNRTEVDAISPTLAADFDEFTPQVFLGTPGFSTFDAVRVKEGAPLGQLYGLLFNNFEDGKPVFKDVNRDKIACDCPDDYTDLGNAFPRFTMGISNQFRWKALEASFFLRGVFGHKLVNAHLMRFGFWQDGTYNVDNIAVTDERESALRGGRFSDLYVENGSYVQLENVVVGYNFKAKKLSQLKVYAAAQNLFTLSKYSGVDPEVQLNNRFEGLQGNLTPGFDVRMAYFPTRTFTLGVQVEF